MAVDLAANIAANSVDKAVNQHADSRTTERLLSPVQTLPTSAARGRFLRP